jgi:amino acid adenylation domain-containing protein
VLSEFNLVYLLEKSSAVYPTKVAIEDSSENRATYKELNIVSEETKNVLTKYNLGMGNRIGILTPKCIHAVKFIFAILKSGAAYVPLDNNSPINRISFIINDCSLHALFIKKSILTDLACDITLWPSWTEVNINEEYSLLVFNQKNEKHKESLAYIIYTSGSTGTPKGVKHTHCSAYSFIHWTVATFSPSESDRFLGYAPFHFDLSIFDIFTSIYVGATLVLIDDKILTSPLLFAQYLSQKNINILYSTPSALSYMATYGKMERNTYKNLKLILFAGEVFPINQLRNLKSKLPETTFFNLYGPTETNVCTWYKIPDVIPDNKNEPYPIGKVCNYAQYKIIKDNGNNQNSGELLITGDSLMSGYWNDIDKTNLAIEIDKEGKLWYHTGDIVTLTDDNNLVYLRRKDRMVKRNGYRIELNEIEYNLISNKNVMEVAVTANNLNNQTDTVITAHIVWVENKKLSTLDLLNYCHTVLPTYMIPDNFKFYEYLPKTSTHKIDYNQLIFI